MAGRSKYIYVHGRIPPGEFWADFQSHTSTRRGVYIMMAGSHPRMLQLSHEASHNRLSNDLINLTHRHAIARLPLIPTCAVSPSHSKPVLSPQKSDTRSV